MFIRKSDDQFCHLPYHWPHVLSYREKFGIPRQPNLVNIESYIDMVEPYNDLLAFKGIEQFSHLWLVWQFHDNKIKAVQISSVHRFVRHV